MLIFKQFDQILPDEIKQDFNKHIYKKEINKSPKTLSIKNLNIYTIYYYGLNIKINNFSTNNQIRKIFLYYNTIIDNTIYLKKLNKKIIKIIKDDFIFLYFIILSNNDFKYFFNNIYLTDNYLFNLGIVTDQDDIRKTLIIFFKEYKEKVIYEEINKDVEYYKKFILDFYLNIFKFLLHQYNQQIQNLIKTRSIKSYLSNQLQIRLVILSLLPLKVEIFNKLEYLKLCDINYDDNSNKYSDFLLLDILFHHLPKPNESNKSLKYFKNIIWELHIKNKNHYDLINKYKIKNIPIIKNENSNDILKQLLIYTIGDFELWKQFGWQHNIEIKKRLQYLKYDLYWEPDPNDLIKMLLF